jgi:hypothetical protein
MVSPPLSGLAAAAVVKAQATPQPGAPPADAPAGPAPAATMTDIHPLKPVVNMGMDLSWWPYAAGALVVLAAIVLAWWFWRRRQKPAGATPATPPLPPDQEALQRLSLLAADRAIDRKLYYFRLSEILRLYVERRFDFPAAEMTTEELLPCIDRLDMPLTLAQPFKAFCRACDPIKFAGAAADVQRMQADMGFAREFVEHTTRLVAQAAEAEAQPPQTEKKTSSSLPAPPPMRPAA